MSFLLHSYVSHKAFKNGGQAQACGRGALGGARCAYGPAGCNCRTGRDPARGDCRTRHVRFDQARSGCTIPKKWKGNAFPLAHKSACCLKVDLSHKQKMSESLGVRFCLRSTSHVECIFPRESLSVRFRLQATSAPPIRSKINTLLESEAPFPRGKYSDTTCPISQFRTGSSNQKKIASGSNHVSSLSRF